MSPLPSTTAPALAVYVVLGAMLGLLAVIVSRAVYAVEDAFERLPIHWMWWPMIGAIAVGITGYFEPRTLGVGYENITGLLSGHFTLQAAAVLLVLKFVSWSISLGSGTSGGTLAPLFTIGGGLGMVGGSLVHRTHSSPPSSLHSRRPWNPSLCFLASEDARQLFSSARCSCETAS